MDFLSDIDTALGGMGRATSGARTLEQQEALARAGKTRARGPNAPHVRKVNGKPGAVDLVDVTGTEAEITQRLTQAGYPVSRVRAETGKGKNQGTGKHLHVEFGPARPDKAVVSAATGVESSSRNVGPSAPQAPLPETQDPYKMAPVIASMGTQVQGKAAQLADTLDRTMATLQTFQQDRIADTRHTNDLKRAALDDVESQTKEAQAALAPIFAQRSELAKRKVELAKMSPLKREFLGIFNRNYNVERLDEIDNALKEQEGAVVQQYSESTALVNSLLNVTTGRANSEEAVRGEEEKGVALSLDAESKSFELLKTRLNEAVNGVQTGVVVGQAQTFARNRVLAELTPQDLNVQIAQAQQNGGQVVIGGVPMGVQELSERADQLQQRDLSMRSLKQSIAAQDEQLIERDKAKLVDTWSKDEITTAIKNGGIHEGVQFSTSMLTSALATKTQQETLLLGDTVNSLDAQTYTATIDSYNFHTQETLDRFRSLTGSTKVPEEYGAYVNNMVALSRNFTKKLREAPEAIRPRLRAEFLGQIQELRKGQELAVDKTVMGMTNNKDAQLLLSGFLKGNTPTNEQAVKGLVGLIGNGTTPPGVNMQGPAGVAIRAAQMAIAGVKAKYDPNSEGNRALVARGGSVPKIGVNQLQAEIEAAVARSVTNTYNQKTGAQILDSLPAYAKELKDPFAVVSPEHYQISRVAAERAAFAQAAKTLGVPDSEIASIFGAKGSKQAGYEKKFGKNPEIPYAKMRNAINNTESLALLQELDRDAPDDRGPKPSELYVNFLNSGALHNGLGAVQSRIKKEGLGDAIVSAISAGSSLESIANYANDMRTALSTVRLERATEARNLAEKYKGNPYNRVKVVLGAIPGLNPQDEAELLEGVRSMVGAPNRAVRIPGVPDLSIAGSNDRIDSFLLHGKFEDPKLEKLRKIAAQHWADYSGATDRALDRYRNLGN